MSGLEMRSITASATPLTPDEEPDYEAIGPLVDYMVQSGMDGILALGTTGEGVLFDTAERRRIAEEFLGAARGRLKTIVHCGAQSTRASAELAAHAAAAGADAVAAIAPAYYPLGPAELTAYFSEVARACAGLPFFIYEFAARSGYQVPVDTILELRERLPNLAGLKVSDTPWERFEPYLIDGLKIYAGPEAFIVRAMEAGAAGAVSGLAAAFPDLVHAVVEDPSEEGSARLVSLRAAFDRLPFQAAIKATLQRRGVPIGLTVRRPLRQLTAGETDQLERLLDDTLSSVV